MKKFIFTLFLIISLTSFSFSYEIAKGKVLKSATFVIDEESQKILKKDFESSINYTIEEFAKKVGAENILDIKMSMHLMGMVITFIYQE